jgi:hypothetical protein
MKVEINVKDVGIATATLELPTQDNIHTQSIVSCVQVKTPPAVAD